jgi:argininosuccinate synthase
MILKLKMEMTFKKKYTTDENLLGSASITKDFEFRIPGIIFQQHKNKHMLSHATATTSMCSHTHIHKESQGPHCKYNSYQNK